MKHIAPGATKAGKFLTSAYAIIEAELPYFLELRLRLNAQGKRGGVEGWAKWCEKHFSCDVRTVNRALSTILGPEKEREPSRKWRPAAEAFVSALEPAIRLARKHKNDPEAAEFLRSLEAEELDGLVPGPTPHGPSLVDEHFRKQQVKKEEIYRMGLSLAQAVVDGSSAIRGDTPEGKKILGIAGHILDKKPDPPQDKPSRSVGDNFVVDEDDLMASGATKDEREPKLNPSMFSMSWGGATKQLSRLATQPCSDREDWWASAATWSVSRKGGDREDGCSRSTA